MIVVEPLRQRAAGRILLSGDEASESELVALVHRAEAYVGERLTGTARLRAPAPKPQPRDQASRVLGACSPNVH